jgi:hypothetical protein
MEVSSLFCALPVVSSLPVVGSFLKIFSRDLPVVSIFLEIFARDLPVVGIFLEIFARDLPVVGIFKIVIFARDLKFLFKLLVKELGFFRLCT